MAVATDNFNAMVKSQTGYTADELGAAFDLVKNKDHWKNAISATIPKSKRGVVAAAVEFYTATKAKFRPIGPLLIVEAAGYRAGPAGDH